MSIRAVRNVKLARIDVIDGATSSFLKELDRVLGRLNRRMGGWIDDFEGQKRVVSSGINITRASRAQAEIEELLLESGYRDSTSRLISAYDKVARMTIDGLEAGGVKSSFTQVDIRALAAIKNMDLRRWEAVGVDLVNAIQSSIIDSVVVGATFKDTAAAIEDILLGADGKNAPIVGRAETIANTLLQAFDRTVTQRQALAAGVENFVYLGPDDERTRPFCSAVLRGKGSAEFDISAVDGDPPIYKREQIEAMDNGQGLPVAQFGGGYNCRHSFEPISRDLAQEVLAQEKETIQ